MSKIPIRVNGPRGHGTLGDVADALSAIKTCLRRVSSLVAGKTFDFDIVKLSHSSAAMIFSPAVGSATEHYADEAVQLFNNTICTLETGGILDPRLDYKTLSSFEGLSPIIGRSGTTLSISDVQLTEHFVTNLKACLSDAPSAHGSVSGTIEKLSIHRDPMFTLYPVFGEDITCRFDRAQLPKVLNAVGRNVTVYGIMHYGKDRMHPVTVEVEEFEIHPEDKDIVSILGLRGINRGDTPSDTSIRKLRDEWE